MKVAVLGAGGPAGFNVCQALKMAGHDVVACDRSRGRLALLTAEFETGRFAPPSDVVWAQPDSLVRKLSEHRADYDARTLLPSHDVIVTCQDKLRTAQTWADIGLRSIPVPFGDETQDWLHVARDAFDVPFWLRSRTGAGAYAATLVDDLRTGYHWIRYWETRGENIDWVAEEYLPGADYCWTSLWFEGDLYASFTRRRDEWLYPQMSPSGITGTPTAATIVHSPLVNGVARAAVTSVDPTPHGAYAVDLREDRSGVPRPTEINAGRWPTTSPLYAELGANLPDMAVRLAMDCDVEMLGEDVYPEGVRLHRHIDCGHVFTPAVAKVAAAIPAL